MTISAPSERRDDQRRVERALDALLAPRRVVVVGASARRRTLGNQVLDNLTAAGFDGDVVAVHPRGERIAQTPTVRSISDVPGTIDAAVVCVPAASVNGVLEALKRHRCRAAVVPTAGFSDQQAAALRGAWRSSRLTVHGPNCLGVLSVASRAPLWTARLRRDLAAGPVAIVAQSGSAAIALMASSDLGFSRVVSTGNELAVSTADYLHWLAGDDATAVVAAVIESIGDPASFAAAVAALRAAGKSLVVLKAGRTAAGTRATVAHTGAIVSSYETYRAFLHGLGVPLVADYDELVATLECMVASRGRAARGSAVAIVTISGGQSALASDLLTEVGACVATFGETTRRRVSAALPGVGGDNPIDLNASVDPGRRTADALDAVLAEPAVDSVLVVQDSQRALPLSSAHPYVDHVRTVLERSGAAAKPVVIASSSSAPIHPQIAELAVGSNIAIVRGLRQAAVALRNLAAIEPRQPVAGVLDASAVRRLRDDIGNARGALPRALTDRLLAAYGLPLADAALVDGPDEAVAAAQRIGFPAVVKVVSRELPHRSDVGGVVVGAATGDQVATAIDLIRRRVRSAAPEARIEGFEIQRQVLDAVEVLVGFQREPPFGATVAVGSGGALAELRGDAALQLAPVSAAEAIRMIEDTAVGAVLSGYRQLVVATDLAPLAEVVRRLSSLAADLGDLIGGGDLNPVLVQPGCGRVTIVDALLTGAAARA